MEIRPLAVRKALFFILISFRRVTAFPGELFYSLQSHQSFPVRKDPGRIAADSQSQALLRIVGALNIGDKPERFAKTGLFFLAVLAPARSVHGYILLA